MNKSRLFYSLLGLICLAAAAYFVVIYLTPSENFSNQTTPIRGANVTFVKSEDFGRLESLVNLPIKATTIGWPQPFQSIFERGNVPGVYIQKENENANANVNGNTNAGRNSPTPSINYNLNLNAAFVSR